MHFRSQILHAILLGLMLSINAEASPPCNESDPFGGWGLAMHGDIGMVLFQSSGLDNPFARPSVGIEFGLRLWRIRLYTFWTGSMSPFEGNQSFGAMGNGLGFCPGKGQSVLVSKGIVRITDKDIQHIYNDDYSEKWLVDGHLYDLTYRRAIDRELGVSTWSLTVMVSYSKDSGLSGCGLKASVGFGL